MNVSCPKKNFYEEKKLEWKLDSADGLADQTMSPPGVQERRDNKRARNISE